MRRRGAGVAVGLVLLAGCGACTAGGGPAGPGDRVPRAAATTAATSLPLERGPVVLRCADAARGISAPAPSLKHVEGLASDGWEPLAALPTVGVSAGGRPYRFVKAFLYLTAQAAPRTVVSVVSPADAWLYYTDFGTWTTGHGPLVGPVPHGPSRQVEVDACTPAGAGSGTVDAPPTGYTGGLLLAAPGCVVLRFSRSDTPTSRTATFRYGVRTC
jgi:hypothetical protein